MAQSVLADRRRSQSRRILIRHQDDRFRALRERRIFSPEICAPRVAPHVPRRNSRNRAGHWCWNVGAGANDNRDGIGLAHDGKTIRLIGHPTAYRVGDGLPAGRLSQPSRIGVSRVLRLEEIAPAFFHIDRAVHTSANEFDGGPGGTAGRTGRRSIRHLFIETFDRVSTTDDAVLPSVLCLRRKGTVPAVLRRDKDQRDPPDFRSRCLMNVIGRAGAAPTHEAVRFVLSGDGHWRPRQLIGPAGSHAEPSGCQQIAADPVPCQQGVFAGPHTGQQHDWLRSIGVRYLETC